MTNNHDSSRDDQDLLNAYRKNRESSPADLDLNILRAAQEAVAPRRRRHSWVPALASAAVIVIAVGIVRWLPTEPESPAVMADTTPALKPQKAVMMEADQAPADRALRRESAPPPKPSAPDQAKQRVQADQREPLEQMQPKAFADSSTAAENLEESRQLILDEISVTGSRVKQTAISEAEMTETDDADAKEPPARSNSVPEFVQLSEQKQSQRERWIRKLAKLKTSDPEAFHKELTTFFAQFPEGCQQDRWHSGDNAGDYDWCLPQNAKTNPAPPTP